MFSNIFSKTALQIIAKIHVKHALVRGAKDCLGYLGRMTKMVAIPVFGKNMSKIFSGTKRSMALKSGV